MTTLTSKELSKRLPTNLSKFLDFDEAVIETRFSPKKLLTHKRADIYAKLYYANEILNENNSNWPLQVYLSHIQTFNNYIEDDNSGKIGKKAFTSSFEKLILSYRKHGHNVDSSIIAVDKDYTIIDGAHRVAAAIATDQQVTIARFPSYQAQHYRLDYFTNKGLDLDVADFIALKIAETNKNTYILFRFPVAKKHDCELKQTINNYGTLIYNKELYLSEQGKENLIHEIYRGEKWLGTKKQKTAGFLHHLHNRFNGAEPVGIYLIESQSLEHVLAMKKEIRNLYEIGNDSVHINDKHSETTLLSKLLFNKNSIHFLNNSSPISAKTHQLIKQYKTSIENEKTDDFCISGSAILGLYGIKDPNDLDYFCIEKQKHLIGNILGNHEDQAQYLKTPIEEIVTDPKNYFYYENLKALSLNNIIALKKARGEIKDIKDIKITIEKISQPNLYTQTKNFLLYYFKLTFSRGFIKKITPRFFHPILKKAYKLLKEKKWA